MNRILILIALVVRRLRRMRGSRVGSIVPRSAIGKGYGWLHLW